MGRTSRGDNKSKQQRQQTILRLIQENPIKMQARFETIFHESVLGVDFAGHVVLVKCYSGMANAACEVFDALKWKNVVGTLSGDDTFLIVARSERDAKTICTELGHYIGQK